MQLLSYASNAYQKDKYHSMEEREDGDKSKLDSDTHSVGINGITSHYKVSQRHIFAAHAKGNV